MKTRGTAPSRTSLAWNPPDVHACHGQCIINITSSTSTQLLLHHKTDVMNNSTAACCALGQARHPAVMRLWRSSILQLFADITNCDRRCPQK
jgi:hypothetical protein